MSEPPADRWSDARVDRAIGVLLQVGVLLSAVVVLIGAGLYLWHYGRQVIDYQVFRGEPGRLRQVGAILASATALRGRDVIQLGLLLLVATPVARVVFAVWAFRRQRDRLYTGVSLIVLAVLLFSLFFMS